MASPPSSLLLVGYLLHRFKLDGDIDVVTDEGAARVEDILGLRSQITTKCTPGHSG